MFKTITQQKIFVKFCFYDWVYLIEWVKAGKKGTVISLEEIV